MGELHQICTRLDNFFFINIIFLGQNDLCNVHNGKCNVHNAQRDDFTVYALFFVVHMALRAINTCVKQTMDDLLSLWNQYGFEFVVLRYCINLSGTINRGYFATHWATLKPRREKSKFI